MCVDQRLVVRREDGGVLGLCVRSPKTSSEGTMCVFIMTSGKEGREGVFRDYACVDWRLHVDSG